MPNLAQLTDYDTMGNATGVNPTIADTGAMPTNSSVVVNNVINKLFRDDDQRYQLWPEKVARSALTAPHDALTGKINPYEVDPDTGELRTSQEMIGRSLDMASLAGTGGLAGAEEGAVLNATPSLRPALKYKDKLYKGKPGQEHQDVIPAHLWPEFNQMAMSGEDISHYNFGFVNDKGHFMNRDDALKYGIDSGIIDPQAGKFGALTSTLMADSFKPGVAIESLAKANNRAEFIKAYAKHAGMSPDDPILKNATSAEIDRMQNQIGEMLGHPSLKSEPNWVDAYHGTVSGFKGNTINKDNSFHQGFYTAEKPELANIFANPFMPSLNETASVLPLKVNTSDYHVVDAKGGDWARMNNKAVQEASELGKSGVTIHNVMESKELGPQTIHIALDPSTVRSKFAKFNPDDFGKNGLLLADSSKPGTAIEAMAKAEPFYSALEHNIKNINQTKMTGDQWLGTLANKPGVKPEELDWTGLKGFLEENKGKPVTKEQIEEHLQNNKVELKEVNKGDAPAKYDPRTGQPDRVYPEGTPFNPTKYHSYQLPGGPLSRDTEILTDRGWKRIDAVEIGDVVMTRKDEAGILEWQSVEATPKVYAENLYHFYSQSIDMRVTENHQMIAKKRRRNGEGLQRLTAKKLWSKSEMLIPLTGNWAGEDEDKIFGFDANDFAELFGWYLAEGSCKLNNSGGKNTIQISQCREYNPEKCARIEALLDRMSLPWRYYGDAYGIEIKTINKDLVELFHEQPTSEFKFIPYFFFKQSKSIIQSLLDGLILGDGCTSVQEGRLDKTTFFTKSWQLAGDVQALILMIGKNANVRQRPSGLYCVGIKSKEWSSVDEAKFEIAPYNDFAFCVTVENHAIYVRRNGVAAFTGNSNYREKLLTLPEKKYNVNKKIEWKDSDEVRYKELAKNIEAKERQGMTDGITEAPSEWYDEFQQLQEKRIANKSENAELASYMANNSRMRETNYKSSHWDEPNILAHVRMNDRTIDGKKSLHLEEIQSDWHQQGRDKGYKVDFSDKDKFRFNELTDKVLTNQTLSKTEKEEFVNLKHKQDDSSKGIPNAPFKKTWHELALKRMIREAAEKGYDRLSWTPGEAQAARYDLSKTFKDITAHKNSDGTFEITATDVGKNRPHAFGSNISPDKVTDYVGKELGEKIVSQNGTKKYEGSELKIGGEGMKGFYDQIIPKALEKIGKEHGVKVKQDYVNPVGRKIDKTDPEDIKTSQMIHYIDIPQSLKDQAMHKGFPLFSSTHIFTPVAGNPFEDNK